MSRTSINSLTKDELLAARAGYIQLRSQHDAMISAIDARLRVLKVTPEELGIDVDSGKPKRRLSAAARARIADGQKRRWAAHEAKKKAVVASVVPEEMA
jgi:hypothetical protein